MKKIPFLTGCCFVIIVMLSSLKTSAQSEIFDITSYSAPKAWKSQSSESMIQFSIEDEAKGSYCLIMLFKSLPATADSKANFDAAWETVVKEAVTVSSPPEMQPVATENGWEAQTGYAPFESNGSKGVIMLVTSTGFEKMVNILILTYSDIYEKDITDFLGSISFKQTSPSNKPVPDPSKKSSPNTITKQDGFAFNTTNFDDGWTSTVQEDWVEVIKGNIKVLLHYRKEGTIFPADPQPLTNPAWNILLAPRYSNLKNYRTAYISTYNRPYLGMGYATDNATGIAR